MPSHASTVVPDSLSHVQKQPAQGHLGMVSQLHVCCLANYVTVVQKRLIRGQERQMPLQKVVV